LHQPTLHQLEFIGTIKDEKKYFQGLFDEHKASLGKKTMSCDRFGMPIMNFDGKVIATTVENSSSSSDVETLMSAIASSTHNEVSVIVVDLRDMICYIDTSRPSRQAVFTGIIRDSISTSTATRQEEILPCYFWRANGSFSSKNYYDGRLTSK